MPTCGIQGKSPQIRITFGTLDSLKKKYSTKSSNLVCLTVKDLCNLQMESEGDIDTHIAKLDVIITKLQAIRGLENGGWTDDEIKSFFLQSLPENWKTFAEGSQDVTTVHSRTQFSLHQLVNMHEPAKEPHIGKQNFANSKREQNDDKTSDCNEYNYNVRICKRRKLDESQGTVAQKTVV
jgi:gag-polypeptide of LTR copia-type